MRIDIEVTCSYILKPVIKKGDLTLFEFFLGKEKQMEFQIPYQRGVSKPKESEDFYGVLNAVKYKGQTLTMEADVDDEFIQEMIQTNILPSSTCDRPLIHFTPDTGWMNDPNGLYFDGEYYHLYFQHNPFSVDWGNMTWGHTRTKDLLHYEKLPDVLYNDAYGVMYSGCAFIDEKNKLGYGAGTPVFYYTAAGSHSKWSAGRKSIQGIAYTPDNGMTLVKDGIAIPEMARCTRDPKVYYHEKAGVYYMILFVDEPDLFAIFTSKDLRHWEESQRLNLPGLRECPDLRILPTDTGEEVYILSAADDTYVTGSFDGYRFTPDHSGVRCGAKTSIPYAAQTFANTDRVLRLSWLRLKDEGKPYTSAQSLPRELFLRKDDQGVWQLMQKLPREYEEAKEILENRTLTAEGQTRPGIGLEIKEKASVEVKLTPAVEQGDFAQYVPSFSVLLFHTDILYNAKDHILTVMGVKDHSDRQPLIELKEEAKAFSKEQSAIRNMHNISALTEISMIVDGNILEITMNGGSDVWIYELSRELYTGEIKIESTEAVHVEISTLR